MFGMRTLLRCGLIGATMGYSLSVTMPGMSRGTAAVGAQTASLASVKATAVSFSKAGLCKKLEVPKELLDSVDVFIFDCDGVIWKGDSLIDKVPAVLDMLRKAGKRVFFVTNNSTKSRKGYLGKFQSLGLESTKAEEIFSSSFAAAAYLEQTKFKETGKKVYIIGEVGIQEELDMIGVPWIGGGNDAGKKVELKSGAARKLAGRAKASRRHAPKLQSITPRRTRSHSPSNRIEK